MELRGITTLWGPNIYQSYPVIVGALQLNGLSGTTTKGNDAFVKRLLDTLPGLIRHECISGKIRQLAARLAEGTSYGHVIEHVAIELALQAQCPVNFAKTVQSDALDECKIVLGFIVERPIYYALTMAVEIVRSLLAGDAFAVEPALFRIRELVSSHAPRQGTRAIIKAAGERDIPIRRIPGCALLQLGHGKHRKLMLEEELSLGESPAMQIIEDRGLMRQLLQFAKIPIPDGSIVESEEEAEEAFLSLNGVVEIKPCRRKGLTWIGKSVDGVKHAFREVRKVCGSVIIEEHLDGVEYDLAVIDGRIVSVTATAAPSAAGLNVAEIHPGIHNLCRSTTEALGLKACRLTLITPDISKVRSDTDSTIVGVDTLSSIVNSLHPEQLDGIVKSVVEFLFPPNSPSRIPLLAISGAYGKTTTAQLISHGLSSTGTKTGAVITDGIMIDGEYTQKADPGNPSSVWALLFNPSIEAGVIEVPDYAPEFGLGYERSDVGIFLNLDRSNYKRDETIAHASLIAERVTEGGTIILNAEDPTLAGLPDREALRAIDRNIVFFASTIKNIRLKSHILAGGKGYYLKSGDIIEAGGANEETVCDVRSLSFTMGGMIDFQVQDLLAAIAGLRAFGVKPQDVQLALQSFNATAKSGRMEIYKTQSDAIIVLDRASKPGAVAAVGSTSRAWAGENSSTVVIRAHSSAPDSMILQSGAEAARHFDRLILTEEKAKAGRKHGETAQLLLQGALSQRRNLSYQIVLSEKAAFETALEQIEPRNLLYLLTDNTTMARALFTARFCRRIDSLKAGESEMMRPSLHAAESSTFWSAT